MELRWCPPPALHQEHTMATSPRDIAPGRSPHPPVDSGDVGGIPSTLDAGVEESKTRSPVLPDRAQGTARPAATGGYTDQEEDDRYGDPAKVKNEGLLESLGKAISSPVVDSEPEPGAQRRR
jgi:hypothetical protein